VSKKFKEATDSFVDLTVKDFSVNFLKKNFVPIFKNET